MNGHVISSTWPTPEQLDMLVPQRGRTELEYAKIHGYRVCVGQVDECRVLLSIDRAEGRDYFHVSASRPVLGGPALPSWEQLRAVRDAMFRPDAVVFQIFPPASEWYSHADVLHLWQRIGADRIFPDLRRADTPGQPGPGTL